MDVPDASTATLAPKPDSFRKASGVPTRYVPPNPSHLTMLDRAIMLLEHDIEHRREEDVLPLLGWWRRRSDVFKRLRNENLVTLIRFCTLRLCEEHEIILRQGEMGDSCFIVLTGKVSVYIVYMRKDANEENESEETAGQENGAADELARQRKKTILPEIGRFAANRKLLGTYVVTLATGAPFGEMALLSQDRVRKAYVVADERMYVLEIGRELFDKTIKMVMEEDYRDKRFFINNYPLFRGWRPDYKEQLAMAFERFVYNFGEVIVAQGDVLDSLFFVVSGEVYIEVNASQHADDVPATARDCRDRLDAIGDEIEAICQSLAHRYAHSRSITAAVRAVQADSAYIKANEERNSSLRIYALRAVELIGDLELLFGADRSLQTAIAAQRTVVLKLELKHVDRLIAKRNAHGLRLLLDAMKEKLSCRLTHNQHAKVIPLFRYALLRCFEMQKNDQKLSIATNPANESVRQKIADSKRAGKQPVPAVKAEADPLARAMERGNRDIPDEYLLFRLGATISKLINIRSPPKATETSNDKQNADEKNEPSAEANKRAAFLREQAKLIAEQGMMTDREWYAMQKDAAGQHHKLLNRRPKRRSRSAVLYSYFAPVQALEVVDLHSLAPDLPMLLRNLCYFTFRNKELFVNSSDK